MDTSIWVEVLRVRNRPIDHSVISIIKELTEADFVYTSKLIIAELIAGAKNRTEAQGMEQDFEGYRLCTEDIRLFRDAGYARQEYMRSFRRRRIPGLIDCYLVNLAKKENLMVFTADRSLQSVAEFQGVKGIFFSIQSRQVSNF